MRNSTINILKAVAIILVVLAHSNCPTLLSQISSMLCASLFFVASGYCFKASYLTDQVTFVKRRFVRLYLPFVKWSVFFLVLNALWFYIGILNDQYGTSSTTAQPLSLHQGLQSLWSIVFNMSGYDSFLCSGYWFFRALLVSSLLFIAGMSVTQNIRWIRGKLALSAALVGGIAVLLALWQTAEELTMTGMAQGGYRELMGTFFFSVGFLFQRYDHWTSDYYDNDEEDEDDEDNDDASALQLIIDGCHRSANALRSAMSWVSMQSYLTLPVTGTALYFILHSSAPAMTTRAQSLSSVLLLAASGIVGFSFTYNVADLLRRILPLKKILDFIGENTICIFGFHLLAFKLVSMLKVGLYGLPWLMVGCYPVVNTPEGAWFWMLYATFGAGLPLLFVYIVRYCKERYDLNSYTTFAKRALTATYRAGRFLILWIWAALKFSAIKLWEGTKWIVVRGWTAIYNFCLQFVDTVKAGADVNQDKELLSGGRFPHAEEEEYEEEEYEEEDYEEEDYEEEDYEDEEKDEEERK